MWMKQRNRLVLIHSHWNRKLYTNDHKQMCHPQSTKKSAANVVTVFNQKELTVSDFLRIIQSSDGKKKGVQVI